MMAEFGIEIVLNGIGNVTMDIGTIQTISKRKVQLPWQACDSPTIEAQGNVSRTDSYAMVSRRILMYEATLVALGLVTPIESFSAQRANRRQIGHIAWRCHAITSNSEWEARNVYDDLDFLRQSIAKDQAEDRLREFQRRRLLNTFATNRRALLPSLTFILPLRA